MRKLRELYKHREPVWHRLAALFVVFFICTTAIEGAYLFGFSIFMKLSMLMIALAVSIYLSMVNLNRKNFYLVNFNYVFLLIALNLLMLIFVML